MLTVIFYLILAVLFYWLSLLVPLWRHARGRYRPSAKVLTYKAAAGVLPCLLVAAWLWWPVAVAIEERPLSDLIREVRAGAVSDWKSAAESYRLASEIHRRMERGE